MKTVVRSFMPDQKWPTTQVLHLLDGQMTLCFRSWGSQDYNQKLIDEVTHYMSSAQADIDVTSPFDFKENLSSLANKARIALLLVHDYFYKVTNKNEFLVGFEALILFRLKKEIAWASVGRFSLQKIQSDYLQTIFEVGSDLDSQILLPAQLLGVEIDVELQVGSVEASETSELLVCSVFEGRLTQLPSLKAEVQFTTTTPKTAYWYVLIKGA